MFLKILRKRKIYENFENYMSRNYMSLKIIWVEIIWVEIIWNAIIWIEIIWNVTEPTNYTKALFTVLLAWINEN